MYYFIDFGKRPSGGYGPKLREGIEFSEIALPADPARFGLYHIHRLPKKAETKRIKQVSWPLGALLMSGEAYSPVLAICRDEIGRMTIRSTEEFEAILMDRLQFHFACQKDKLYFLAKALRDEVGYKSAGSYYWIVSYRPERVGAEISWVSSDYFIYRDAITDFDIDPEWLANRFSG